MGDYRISLEIDGKPEFDRVFQRVDAAFSDLTPVWETVRDAFYQIEKAQFASEGAVGGSGQWKPLSAAYERRKIAKYGPTATILRASDRLLRSLVGHSADSILEISPDGITIGSALPYARYHQRGGGKLPRREPISFSDAQKRDLQKSIQRTMVGMMRRTGAEVEG